MTTQRISIDRARRIVLRAQLLDGREGRSIGKEGVARAIENLGYVQIDTIAVVERAHHHTLWTRCPDYDPGFLHELQASDRRVFEYWAHAIAYLPMADYRFYLPRMERVRKHGPKWLGEWRKRHGSLLEQVLARIRKEGALTSKDFEPPPGTKRGTWWDWKPAKRALEILFWQGDLMIAERRNFQKVYDLTERVLPANVDTSKPTEEEMGRFHVHRVLRACGLAREREVRNSLHVADRALIARTLAAMVGAGEVMRILVSEIDEPYYGLPGALDGIAAPRRERAFLLSPFDNLTIQRQRIQQLFDFDYALECYLPPAQRKYGYFVLPILWDARLIGRLDPKADRKTNRLIVRSLRFEPDFNDFDDALPAVADALSAYARFNQCVHVEVEKIAPTGHKRRLKGLVKNAMERREDREET